MSKLSLEQIKQAIANMPQADIEATLSFIKKQLGASDSINWCVEWVVSKFNNGEETPFEVVSAKENVVLDLGATELLKLLGGLSDATAFSNSAAKLYVGSASTAENAAQTGVQSPLGYASMDVGFPSVSGRNIVFQATFGNDDAIGEWRELAVTNGSGSGNIALNRKVADMGRKTDTTNWVLKVTISVVNSVTP